MPSAKAIGFWAGRVPLLTAGAVLLPSALAFGQQAATAPPSWLTQSTMTDDWLGWRSSLEAVGITPSAHFITESAANPVGGKFSAIRYAQQIDFGAVFDLGRLAGLDDGKIQVVLTDRAGRSLSADAIGNFFPVQEIYGAGQNFRLAELNYQQSLFDNSIRYKLGWSPVGDDFATSPYYCYFTNNAVCGKPPVLAADSGAHNFPVGQWGANIKVFPRPELYGATGIYQVNPNAGNSSQGFNLSFNSTGAFVPIEFGWLPKKGPGGLPGEYKIGGYFNTSKSPDVLRDVTGRSAGLTGLPFDEHNGRWGGYVLATQMVYLERPDSKRGLTLFGAAVLNDPQTAHFSHSLEFGAVYQGTFPHRDDDYIGLVFAYGAVNKRLTEFQIDRNIVDPGSTAIQRYEALIEVDYNAQITPWLSLRPNLQYVINPGGTGKIPNAFVVGLHTQVTF
ncbi:carbohydrate porin [Microvirga sp. M2]|uniref:carbohydrate porin n=1 Tax=Microvirga sp. M2 TaxID=3073270 RepID=UPI0039C30F93